MTNFTAFKAEHGACDHAGKRKKAPIIQEFLRPPLIRGCAWHYRVYAIFVSLDPLVVFRRLGDIKICSEPYSRRNDPDPDVRSRATKCHTTNGISHPNFGKPGGITINDLQKPVSDFPNILEGKAGELAIEKTDDALRTTTSAMARVLKARVANSPITDHTIGYYAFDLMMNSHGEVKVIEVNCAPIATSFSQDGIGTDERHGLPYAEDFTRLGLTALYQYGMKDDNFSVDKCGEQFPWLDRLI